MGASGVLRLGIAGLGAGARNLLPGLARNPRVKITAAADLRREALESFAREFGVQTFLSVEEMCRRSRVDVVWVATPNHLHAEHAITAAEHGKHVIVSKPMAVTLEECEAMCRAAERNGIRLLVGHSQGMGPTVRKMAELVQSGQFGPLGMVHTWHYTNWFYRPRLAEELDESRGGGAVFRQGPHQVDIVREVARRRVRSVRAMAIDLDPARRGTGGYVAYLELEGRIPATLVYSGYGRFSMSELTFGVGPVHQTIGPGITPEEEARMKEARRYRGEDIVEERGHGIFGLTLVSCQRADLRQSPRGVLVYERSGAREVEVPMGERRGDAEIEEMYEALFHDRPLLHDGRWGMATQQVVLAILESSRSAREVVFGEGSA